MSIGARLTISVVGLLLIIFLVLGLVIVSTTRTTLIAQVDARLGATLQRIEPGEGPFHKPGGFFEDRDGPLARRGGNKGDANPDRGKGPDGTSPAVVISTNSGISLTLAGCPRAGDFITTAYDERPVAQIVFDNTGKLIAYCPSGFKDAPDSPPVLPRNLANYAGKTLTVPAVDGGPAYRAAVQSSPRGTIVTAASLTEVNNALARIVRMLIVAGTATMALAAVGCWLLIRHGLQPVDRIVDAAADIAAGDLSRRVPTPASRGEIRRLSLALNDMLGQIEAADQARARGEERLRQFVADAAHELRTPLTSLRGYAELYRQGALGAPESVANAMGRIESEGARMARLVDDLLLLARLDQQRGLEREPVDLAVIAREAVADFAAVEPERPLFHDLPGPALVLGDRLRLRQIIDNLLANVRRHTSASTPLHVSLRREPQAVTVVVRDEGAGIPAAMQPRVFERFWRGDPSRASGGAGLGLSIVSSLVSAHGGEIRLRSAEGKGAEFSVHLPLIDRGPVRPEPAPDAGATVVAKSPALAGSLASSSDPTAAR